MPDNAVGDSGAGQSGTDYEHGPIVHRCARLLEADCWEA
jgi:hypothetical protein